MKRIITTLLISFMLVSLMAYAFRVNAQVPATGVLNDATSSPKGVPTAQEIRNTAVLF